MGIEDYQGRELTIHFDGKKCIHSRNCVLGQPAVFRANVEGPWIQPDSALCDDLVALAKTCPSGAITYTRNDGGAAEAPPPVNALHVRENGPLALHADLYVDGRSVGARATLCRCGASKNKPFCDGSHSGAGFKASGEPASRSSQALAARAGQLSVTALPDGPLKIEGNLEICAGSGRTVDRTSKVFLCRCGHSDDKPFLRRHPQESRL